MTQVFRLTDGRKIFRIGGAEQLAAYVSRVEAASGAAEDAVASIADAAARLDNAVTISVTHNQFNPAGVTVGKELYFTDGHIDDRPTSALSGPIFVLGASTITISGLPAHGGPYRNYAFFAQDGVTRIGFVEGQSLIANGPGPVTLQVPAGAWYFRLDVYKIDNAPASYTGIQVEYGPTATSFVAFSAGRLVVLDGMALGPAPVATAGTGVGATFLFGDSITAPTPDGSGAFPFIGTPAYNWSSTALPLIAAASARNFAKSGAAIASVGTLGTFQKLEKQIDAAIATGVVPALIVLAIGTNDIGNGHTFGDFAAAMAKAVNLLDLQLVLEAWRAALIRLRTAYPAAVIMFSTPLPRTDIPLLTMEAGIDQLVRMARLYGVEVIDSFGQAGFVPEVDTSDGLHPVTEPGWRKLGRLIAARILARLKLA